MIGIYKITNKINNKCYIGQSIDVDRRLKQHIKSSCCAKSKNYNYPLYRAFRKYGIYNFDFCVLCECQKQDLTRLETFYYNLYKPEYCQIKPNENPVLNPIIEAKRQAIFQTPEYKAKCSKAMAEDTKRKISNALKNSVAFQKSHNTPEFKEKMRQIRSHGKTANKPVILYKDDFRLYFDSLSECSRWLIQTQQCSSTSKATHIKEVCDGKRKSIFGYKATYNESATTIRKE